MTLLFAPAIDPTAAFALSGDPEDKAVTGPLQSFTATEDADTKASRGDYKVTDAPVAAAPGSHTAPAAGTPNPGSAMAIAHDMVMAKGWGEAQYDCLVALWNKESHWNIYAFNAGSGAYGIPQAVPGNKMASAGADWKTSAKTQITWGLGYIQGRYADPCGAWGHSQSKGWY